jgi:uncharacterized protein YuzE
VCHLKYLPFKICVTITKLHCMETQSQVDFKPQWIIELVRQQEPSRLDVIEALSKCTNGRWESKAYVYFVDATNANQPGAEWQFDENIVIEHDTEGTIVIDFLKSGKIGGIEFVKYIQQ